jgi:predicted PurR-regulated permease PerM
MGPVPTPFDDPSPGQPATRERAIGDGITWVARWSLRWALVAVGAALLGLLVRETWSIMLPVVLALIVATVLAPPTRWLRTVLHLPAVLASAVTLVVALALLVLIAGLILPSVADQVTETATSAGDGLSRIEDWVLDSSLPVTRDQIQDAVDSGQQRLTSSAGSIASGLLVGLSALSSGLVTLLLTLVLVFFFLKDGDRFLPWVQRLAGPRVGGHLAEVGRRSWETLGGFIRTQGLVGLIDAVLIGLALVVLGVPLALALTVLTFFAAFVPVVGAVTVGAVAVLVTLVSNGLTAAIIMLVVILLVQQLEGNVLLPVLQGKSLQLHAAVVLLSVALGSTLFGIVGAFLAVPAVAVAAVVLRYLDEVVRARTEPVASSAVAASAAPEVAEDPGPAAPQDAHRPD